MVQATYVFMDFDGVTHPWGEVEDFRCLGRIEEVMREFEEARIVIASDWRLLFSLPKLVARFAEDIRPRVVGATPFLTPQGAILRGMREREAMAWLEKQGAASGAAAWCALDDAPGNWMTRSRLVLTDFKRGFIEEDADLLRRMLQGFRNAPPGQAGPRPVLQWS